MELVLEQIKEVIPQYLEKLPLAVVVVQDMTKVIIMEDQVGLVVEEHIKIHQEDLEIPHPLVHLKERMVAMEE